MAIIERIRYELLEIPEVASWPELVGLIERPTSAASLPCWEHPMLACRAVGGREEQALPGAVAIFCLLYSIHLVDDLLDQDPQGIQHDLGEGTAANLAVAFQAMGAAVLGKADLAPDCSASIHQSLARTALATAYGQNLDLSELENEDDYWQVVEAKTPPLFGAGLYIGALLGGASEETARSLESLGFLIGKSIQVSDDLKDAFERPAQPDWQRRSNNLPILYASTADHPERQRFLELIPRCGEDDILAAAQEILVRSGAVSFCAYHIIEFHRIASEALASLDLTDSQPLRDLLGQYIKPLKKLLNTAGVESPEDLFM